MYEVARLPCRFVNIGEFSAFLISLSREPRHYSPERVIVANDQWRVVVMLSGRKWWGPVEVRAWLGGRGTAPIPDIRD